MKLSNSPSQPLACLFCLLTLALLPRPGLAFGFLDQDGPIKPWVDKPRARRFSLCFNHSCQNTAIVGLNKKQWGEIRQMFEPDPANAEAERSAIAKAIGRLEVLVAPSINSQNDKGRNFKGSFADGSQLDCIDESTNSTTYLTMMRNDGLLRFHEVRPTSTRGWFIMGMPHTTAVIRESATGTDFAVDSWFHDNGVPPEILPLQVWADGWEPPK